MGLTPLAGLVMGTRSGDIDPAVVFHLHREAGLDLDEIETLLTKQSGLLGLAGAGDVREVRARIAAGDADAAEALDIFCYRVRGYVGAYAAALGRVDAIVFTAGIGENDPQIRAGVCAGLEGFGVRLDAGRNTAPERRGARGVGGRQPGAGAGGADRRGAGDRPPGPGLAAADRPGWTGATSVTSGPG